MLSDVFIPLNLHSDLCAELEHKTFRFSVRSWNASTLNLEADATHFGFVYEHDAELVGPQMHFTVGAGMFFTQPNAGTVGGRGSGLVISQFGYRGMFLVGGPIEERGRLRYIDGCSDTLLISPMIQGEACLNFLHLPPHTQQTEHTHPSFRVGLINQGHGVCRTPHAETQIVPGMAFVIPAEGRHSFHTDANSLDVIAFHPDSDFGPTHVDHPMINRTIISGMAASFSSAKSPDDTSLVLPHSHREIPK